MSSSVSGWNNPFVNQGTGVQESSEPKSLRDECIELVNDRIAASRQRLIKAYDDFKNPPFWGSIWKKPPVVVVSSNHLQEDVEKAERIVEEIAAAKKNLEANGAVREKMSPTALKVLGVVSFFFFFLVFTIPFGISCFKESSERSALLQQLEQDEQLVGSCDVLVEFYKENQKKLENIDTIIEESLTEHREMADAFLEEVEEAKMYMEQALAIDEILSREEVRSGIISGIILKGKKEKGKVLIQTSFSLNQGVEGKLNFRSSKYQLIKVPSGLHEGSIDEINAVTRTIAIKIPYSVEKEEDIPEVLEVAVDNALLHVKEVAYGVALQKIKKANRAFEASNFLNTEKDCERKPVAQHMREEEGEDKELFKACQQAKAENDRMAFEITENKPYKVIGRFG